MADFHSVHCVNCGKECLSGEMAVDLDKLILTHLEKIALTSRNPVYQEAKRILSEIRLGMYLAYFEMVSDRLLDDSGRLKISCKDVLMFIADRYQVELEVEETAWDSDEQQEFVLEAAFEEDITEEDVQKRKDEQEEIFDELCVKMRLYNEVDIEKSKKRKCIRDLIYFLRRNPDVVILECTCIFHRNCDDQGKEYFSSLQVKFIDQELKELLHMVCPNCGEPFFIHAGKYEEKVIVMLGSSRVGKTAYLAALIDEINPEFGQSHYENIVVEPTSDARYTFFKENILKQYRRGEKIVKTAESSDVAALFSFEVAINGKTLILTLVDLPGEVFVPRNEEEKRTGEATGSFIINHRRICYSADAFWFCIDPVQIDHNLHGMNDKSSKSDKVEMDLDMILANIANTVSFIGKEGQQGGSRIPTAIMITKSDLIDPGFCLFGREKQEAMNCLCAGQQLSTDKLNVYSRRVKKYMQSDNVKNIVQRLNGLFQQKNYFSVAAYGMQVGEEGVPEGKEPYGIILPFLWTLACFGYLTPVKLEPISRKAGFFRREVIDNQYVDARQELFME